MLDRHTIVHNLTVCVDFVEKDTFIGISFVENVPKNCFLFAFSPAKLLIHKVGVPLLLFYKKTAVSRGNLQVINRLSKVVKRHLQRKNSRLMHINLFIYPYIFFGTLIFSHYQKFWGGGGGLKLPPAPPLLWASLVS